MIRYKLGNADKFSYQEIIEKVNSGGRFVVYQYTISLLAVTLRRLTPAYFIEPNEHPSKYGSRANNISQFLGWWCIPWGPMRTIQSLSLNKKGGVDVTKDIIINLTEADYKNGIVIIEKIANPFHTPNKDEQKGIRKSLEKLMLNHPALKEGYFALFVNVPNGVEPYFVIGLPIEFFADKYISELKKILSKYFRRNAHFEFILLNKEDELSNKLIEMNLKVGNNSKTGNAAPGQL